MPAAIASLRLRGMALIDPLAERREADDQEQHAGQEHRAERRLPGVAHALDDAVGEIGVEAHARRQRDG